MNTIQPQTVDAQHRNMLILWAAFLAAVVMYGFMTFVMEQEAQESNRMLTIVFSAISVFAVGVSFAVKKKFFARAIDEQQMRLVNTGFVLAAAFCEVGAIMGLLDFLVANDRYYFLLIGLAFIGLLLHFPRRSDLEAANFKKIS
jgi:hypothetical protein